MPSPHSLYNFRVILIVPAYFYMDMYCFGLVRVVSSWLRVGSVEVDSFRWMVVGGFRWFAVLVVSIDLSSRLSLTNGVNFNQCSTKAKHSPSSFHSGSEYKGYSRNLQNKSASYSFK